VAPFGQSRLQEVSGRDAESRRKSVDIEQRDVALTPLDATDVAAIKARGVCEGLLAEPEGLPAASYPFAERPEHVNSARLHV